MKNAQLIVAASNALELYEAGDKQAALDRLQGIFAAPLPDHPEWIASELEKRANLPGVACPAAAREWIEHAQDRLRRELGADILGAVVPVPLALRSALTCLNA